VVVVVVVVIVIVVVVMAVVMVVGRRTSGEREKGGTREGRNGRMEEWEDGQNRAFGVLR
jgi:heme/copper-type cytochrome/quinol oxidase subunit 2